ncbi:MAG: ribulose-phosphate 3-epimerase [Clostridiales bacterium]|jgi:ribulose-phosphate 3-epimerase|nr:ribulose-phosphate 3-epimerase [Clostridiales bacterium]
MEIKISPSLLASDLSRIAEETVKMENAGAHMIHLDVMDGHFVPNITFGAPVIKSLRNKSKIHFDTHLMIDRPDFYAKDFIDAGTDTLTFHAESKCDIKETIHYIKSRNIRVGLAVSPKTDWTILLPYLKDIDMALVMTVEPGFGGQSFMTYMLEKVQNIKAYAFEHNLKLDIQVDGGINDTTGAKAAASGANVIVAGSSLFKLSDYKQGVESLYSACNKAYK